MSDGGELPPVARWSWFNESESCTLLDTILKARAVEIPSNLDGLEPGSEDRALRAWAQLLREHVADFLAGSNECIEEAYLLLLAQGQQWPEVLTIKLPSTATEADGERAIEHAYDCTPEHVKIGVRRYNADRQKNRGE